MPPILTKSQRATFDFARGAGAAGTPRAAEMERTLADLRHVQGSALIIGGVAVIHHSYERSTQDVDVLYAVGDAGIVERLEPHFRVVVKAAHGWHHLEHRETGVRLELVPEGGRTTHGLVPGPQAVGGEDGFISPWGLVWLKLTSGRSKDDADVVEVAKVRLKEFVQVRAKLPAELHARFDELLARARREIGNDPYRRPDRGAPGGGPVKGREAAGRYGAGKHARRRKRKAR